MSGLMAVLTVAMGVAQTAPIGSKWESDYGVALRTAKTAQRPLVVVLEVPHDPAQSVGEEALESGYGRPDLLAEYELCRVDVTTKVGRMVADAFRAEQFPYTAITDQKCHKIVVRHVGKPTPRRWIDMLANRGRLRSRPLSLILDHGILSPSSCFT